MPAARELAIPIPHQEIAAFCRKWGIKRLAFFGSVVRDDFGPESDVDVLVEFKEGRTPGWEFYGTMPEELSRILARKVDLATFDSISKWIRAGVLAEAVEEYDETR